MSCVRKRHIMQKHFFLIFMHAFHIWVLKRLLSLWPLMEKRNDYTIWEILSAYSINMFKSNARRAAICLMTWTCKIKALLHVFHIWVLKRLLTLWHLIIIYPVMWERSKCVRGHMSPLHFTNRMIKPSSSVKMSFLAFSAPADYK